MFACFLCDYFRRPILTRLMSAMRLVKTSLNWFASLLTFYRNYSGIYICMYVFIAMKACALGLYLCMIYSMEGVDCRFFHKMLSRPTSLQCESRIKYNRGLIGCAVACMEQASDCQLFVYDDIIPNCYQCKISPTNTSGWAPQSYVADVTPTLGKCVLWS